MSFVECMKVHTNRQYRTYIKWSQNQWNKPSRTDHYIMDATSELMIANGHKKVNQKKLILPFTFEREDEPKKPSKDRIELSKSVWRSRLGQTNGR